MGQIYSYFSHTKRDELCSDLIDNDFSISITIHYVPRLDDANTIDLRKIVDYLQYTNPVISYAYCKSITLLYNPTIKHPNLRSNISGGIISEISCDITKYCITQDICDVYYVEVSVADTHYISAKRDLFQTIENNLYYGYLHGVEQLSRSELDKLF